METSPGASPRPRQRSRTVLVLALAVRAARRGGRRPGRRGPGRVRGGPAAAVGLGGPGLPRGVHGPRGDDRVRPGRHRRLGDARLPTPGPPSGSSSRSPSGSAGRRWTSWGSGSPRDGARARGRRRARRPGRRGCSCPGRGWGTGEDLPSAAGCGRTRPARRGDRGRLAGAAGRGARRSPRGPWPCTPAAGWVVSNTERTPDVVGRPARGRRVRLRRRGPRALAAGVPRHVGDAGPRARGGSGSGPHLGRRRPPGAPGRGARRRATGRRPAEVEPRGRRPLDRAGVPAGCDEDVPGPRGGRDAGRPAGSRGARWTPTDRLVQAARDGAARAGLRAGRGHRRDPAGPRTAWCRCGRCVPTERAGRAARARGERLVRRVAALLRAVRRHAAVVAGPGAGRPAARRPRRSPSSPSWSGPTGSRQLLLRARPPVVVSVTRRGRRPAPGPARAVSCSTPWPPWPRRSPTPAPRATR